MPFLREAVEKKKKYFIQLLVKGGLLDSYVNSLTLTELEGEYKKLQREKGLDKS
ncbi:hypothetical protein [Bacillus infantis]|uniref:hypothetical protein n=1 Tax=Bacillus infantis TaxID=324767 RepID=UPI003CF5C24D